MLVANGSRFSVAYNVRDKFEEAYQKRQEQLARNPSVIPQPQNKKEYGKGYYQEHIQNMKRGYVHPYHSEETPLIFNHENFLEKMYEAVGPEQVSPHYESLARSRRILIFMFFYLGTIRSVAALGGWDHNEWIRGLIFHHEYLITLGVGLQEIRHHTFLPGPKFSVFYNVYSSYELRQLLDQWSDQIESAQNQFLIQTKQQIEYNLIGKEYEFVKKRALVNFLTNSRVNLENHYQ